MRLLRRWFLLFLPLALVLSGCDNYRIVIHGVEEREANEIVVFLASRGIKAQKLEAKSGGGVGGAAAVYLWNISVQEQQMNSAMSLLNQNGLPRKRGTNLLELFAKQGLMTSEKEETIRYQAGLEQQIANTIRKIDGVIDADVQLSFPSEGATSIGATAPNPSQRLTAAVYVKHQGILDDPNSHLVSKIKRLVAGSINGLDINDVTVISDRSRFTDISLAPSLEGSTAPRNYTSIWSIQLAHDSVARFRAFFIMLITTTLASTFAALWMLWKVYPVLRAHGGLKELLNPAPLQQEPEAPPETTPPA